MKTKLTCIPALSPCFLSLRALSAGKKKHLAAKYPLRSARLSLCLTRAVLFQTIFRVRPAVHEEGAMVPAASCVVGAWLGAIPLCLDWEQPWQVRATHVPPEMAAPWPSFSCSACVAYAVAAGDVTCPLVRRRDESRLGGCDIFVA